MRFACVCALCAILPTVILAQTNLPAPTTAQPASSASGRTMHAQDHSADTAQNTATLLRSNGGSLLRASLAAQPDPSIAKASQISFFAVPPPEPHVVKKHDLITIIVREESEQKHEGTTDLKRQADLDAKIDQYVRYSFNKGQLENGVTTTAPELKVSGTRNFKGEATVDRTDSVLMRIQAEVIDVKPNNTLVLQARASITT